MSADLSVEGPTERQLEGLLASPREDLDLELKRWLDMQNPAHRSNLGKAILALANHGGGWVVIGYIEPDGAWAPDNKNRPTDLSSYSQDAVNGIVARFADPPFHCRVRRVAHPETGDAHPVIQVPGGHRVPIRARSEGHPHVRQHAYYIRRPGPASEEIRSAQEWDDLLRRCLRGQENELMEQFRRILTGGQPLGRTSDTEQSALGQLEAWASESRERFVARAEEAFPDGLSRYQHGVYTIAYLIAGDFEPPPLPQLRDLLRESRGSETGWPPFLEDPAHPATAVGGALESLLGINSHLDDASHSDFWRVAPDGRLYLLRGYDDDAGDTPMRPSPQEPGTVLDVTLPIWRTAAPLLQASRLATALGVANAPVTVDLHWEGLRGRTLSSWASPPGLYVHERRCLDDDVRATVQYTGEELDLNLAEAVYEATRPLYHAFELLEIPFETVRSQVARLRSGA